MDEFQMDNHSYAAQVFPEWIEGAAAVLCAVIGWVFQDGEVWPIVNWKGMPLVLNARMHFSIENGDEVDKDGVTVWTNAMYLHSEGFEDKLPDRPAMDKE